MQVYNLDMNGSGQGRWGLAIAERFAVARRPRADGGVTAKAAAFDAVVRTGRRSLPWRYRWPDDIRDEVLARLLALNAQRADEGRLQGLATQQSGDGAKRKTKQSGRSRKASSAPEQEGLF